MKRISHITLFLLLSAALCGSDRPDKDTLKRDTLVYLFPGQGADERLFKHLELPAGYDTVNISYPVPDKYESMAEFASRFIEEIDQSTPYILMGVSIGGMICTELTDTLTPLHTILISSAKSQDELPDRYTFNQHVRLNRIIPKALTKGGARMLQGIVDMIVNWERTSWREGIIHIHGDRDHTLPIKNISYDYLVEEGSHMMMITRAAEINVIIAGILKP